MKRFQHSLRGPRRYALRSQLLGWSTRRAQLNSCCMSVDSGNTDGVSSFFLCFCFIFLSAFTNGDMNPDLEWARTIEALRNRNSRPQRRGTWRAAWKSQTSPTSRASIEGSRSTHSKNEHVWRSEYKCIIGNLTSGNRRGKCPCCAYFASPTAPMLDWLVALCIVILVVLIWPGSKYFGTESQSDGLFQGLGISQQTTKEETRGCVSDRDGSDVVEAPSAGDATGETARTVALICKPSALANYLLKHCRTFSNYSPCVGWTWRASAFLQSVYEACWPYDSTVQFVRDNLQLSDDGLVALDWAVPSYQKRRRTSSHSTIPVLLIIPNSFGKITRNVLKVIITGFFFLPNYPILETTVTVYIGNIYHFTMNVSFCIDTLCHNILSSTETPFLKYNL